MRKPLTRRRVAAAAALVATTVAVLVPAAGTTGAGETSPGVLRAKLADAIAYEKRAVTLLRKKPPRMRAAALQLDRARESLDEIRQSGSLSSDVSTRLTLAHYRDGSVSHFLRYPASFDDAAGHGVLLITEALQAKEMAMALLQQPAAAEGPQCADGRDNDGDGLVDSRYDGGCTSRNAATETPALTCSLGSESTGAVQVVRGTCSGAFSKLEVTLPPGGAFDTSRMPAVPQAQACRYESARKLECVMSDGAANPRHVVNARFRLRGGSATRLRVLIRDFNGRGRAQSVAPSGAGQSAGHLRFRLSYTHVGLSHVCASIEADSGASLKVTIEGPNGYSATGTLQLKKKAHGTAPGSFSFRIFEFGSYKVTIVSTAGGRSVTKTQTIAVSDAPGDSRCSASGAPPLR